MLAVLVTAALAQDPSYTLDPGQSQLYVLVWKDPSTLASGLSHDHAVLATGWTGTASLDPADPTGCRIDITVPVSELQPDPPDLRAKAGLGPGPGERARGKIKQDMLDEGQLWADEHPRITFTASGCAATGDTVNVSGTLTIRGKAKEVTVPMTVRGDATRFTATGTLAIKATDFGFEPYSALFGQLKNRDEMTLVIDVTGVSGPAPRSSQ